MQELPVSGHPIPKEMPWLYTVSFLESVGSRSLKTGNTYLG